MRKLLSFNLLAVLLCAAASWSCQPGNTSEKPMQSGVTPVLASRADTIPNSGAAANVDLNYLLGKFNPAIHPDFVKVGKPYTDKAGMLLRKETLEAFQKMFEAARQSGINLKIISATRNFAQQKGIWEGKWARFAKDAPEAEARALKILEYSAMPGASRHHWGTDMDLNDLNNEAFETGGKYAKVYEWLHAHAHEYGFCQPYTAKNTERPNGYNEERWHWSYTPLSKPLLEKYLQIVTNQQLTGFKGSETAITIKAVENYAAGINPDCK